MLNLIYILLSIVGYLIYLIFLKPLYKLIKLKIKHGDEIYIKFHPLSGQNTWETINQRKYGNPFEELKKVLKNNPKLKAIAFNLGFNIVVSSVDPELSKSILLENYTKLKKHLPIFNYIMLKNGLPFQEGEEWKQTRKIIADSFHFESLNSRFQVICNVVKQQVGRMKQFVGKDYYPLFDEMITLTGEIGIKVLFGPEFEGYEIDGMPFSRFIGKTLENQFLYSKYSIYFQLKRGFLGDELAMKFLTNKEKILLKKDQEMLEIIKKEVERKLKIFEKNPEMKSDFLVDRLIKAYINKSIPNLTIEKICIQCATFFFAALDTTGTLLGWIFYALSEHKQEADKVQQEINQVFANQDTIENIKFEDMKKLVYTSAFIDECQRKYNSVAGIFHREVIEPFKTGSFSFEKGDLIHQHLYAGFLNPKEFENPDEFKVERFLNGNDKLINPYLFSPFSAGPRNCIGKYMAQLEIKITIIYFLRIFKIERNDNVKLGFKKGFVVDPQDQNLIKISMK